MDNSIIKIMLENKTPRVYSLIVQMYFDKIELYKASVFKVWLAKELNIAPELIHESSISAALSRYKKRQPSSSNSREQKSTVVIKAVESTDFNTEIPEVFPGFK